MPAVKIDWKIVPKEFYIRDPAIVAKELLGKLLIRIVNSKMMGGMIVETEAYYGVDDPASRAFKGRKGKISSIMYEEGGVTLIYMVHGNWLFNIITGSIGYPSGVLIRAIEPLLGIKYMMKNRGINDVNQLTNGPGKLCKALNIDGTLNRVKVYDLKSPIRVYMYKDVDEKDIGKSHRIGVREDLPEPLRFFIKNNRYVSR